MDLIIRQSKVLNLLSGASVIALCTAVVLNVGLADGAQSDLEHSQSLLLIAKSSEQPDGVPGSQGSSGESNSAAVCELSARKAYESCMDGPNADQNVCVRKSEDAERQCLTINGMLPQFGTTQVKVSQGLYRIPYEDGTKVHIMRNFQDHLPPGKIDMAGRGGGTYRIVAAAEGEIRYIEDSREKQQHPQRWLRNTDKCFNNFLWIRHDNGEWSKYSHMQMGTSTAKAGLKVGQRVAKGTYLGDEGHVGCAWPAHLHFEVVVPSNDAPGIDPIDGGFVGYDYDQARNPQFNNDGKVFTFKDGENYVVGGGPCRKDTDCGDGQYCNAGIDLTKNACLPLKSDNKACAAVGGGHQCKSGKCQFGRCYTPQSVEMGSTCYVNDACKAGKCSDIQGVKGVCVCQNDADCGDNDKYCDAGMDFKINECRRKLNTGEKCGKAGSLGNDHKCKSGKCSGFPKYECK